MATRTQYGDNQRTQRDDVHGSSKERPLSRIDQLETQGTESMSLGQMA